MHNKFAVVDGTACVNGSYNWTTGAAMHYQENFVISRHANLAACFSSEFNRMWQAFAPAGAGYAAMAPVGYQTCECLALFFPEHSNGNLDLLVREIGTASKTVDVCVYVITHPRLTDLLVTARRRGVQVRVITDVQQAKVHNRRHIDALLWGGVEVRTNKPPYNMHDKFCIVDGWKLCSGSFNWTQQAEKYNNENCVVFNDEPLAKRFSAEFEKLWVAFATSRKTQQREKCCVQ
jgi:cardiolipin hydrolase